MRHLRSMSIMEPINPCGKYLVKEIVHLFNCVFLQPTSTPMDIARFQKIKLLPPTQLNELSFGVHVL